MLAVMFSGRWDGSRLDDGTFFVDRDGETFGLILQVGAGVWWLSALWTALACL